MQIDRFRLSELSAGRLLEAIGRRISQIPHSITWNRKSGLAAKNRARLRSFRDKHAGERGFLLANGPSLAQIDFNELKGEVTFGLNRIYLMTDIIGFLPDYFVCVNELVLDQFHGEISPLQTQKFLNWTRRHLFSGEESDTQFLNLRLGLRDRFRPNLEEPISSGGTVTFVALEIAFFMGFDQIILVGLDHDYKSRGIPNRTVLRETEQDTDHFDPNYFPKGSLWQPPDLLRSELAYRLAREAFEKAGKEIIDATLGGKCQVFEKRDFERFYSNVER